MTEIGAGIGASFQSESGLTIPERVGADGSLALWLDASDASTVTESAGAVTAWADKSGNGYNFASAGTGSDVTYSGGAIAFAGGKYLSADSSALRTLLSTTTDKTVFIRMKSISVETDGNGATIFASNVGTSDRFTVVNKSGTLRVANYNGSWQDVLGKVRVTGLGSRAEIYSMTWDASELNRTLTINQGASAAVANPVTVSTALTTIGANQSAGMQLTGAITHIIVYDRILSAGEIAAVEGYMAGIRKVCGIGQSNEYEKHSVTSPYAKDGYFGLIDTRNDMSVKNNTVYLNAAVSGSYLSKLAYNAASASSGDWWVDDTGGTPTAGANLTEMDAIISAAGYSGALDFSIANLESEALYIHNGSVTKTQVKTAYEWLLDYLRTNYPGSRFFIQVLGHYWTNYDDGVQICRDIQRELIVENSDVFLLCDMADKEAKGGDGVHYAPAGYAAAGVEGALSIFSGIRGAALSDASISGDTITLTFDHGAGTDWTETDLMPVDNLLADSRDFTAWTKSASCTVTGGTDTGYDGVAAAADTVTKGASTSVSVRKNFSTTAGNHAAFVYLQAGTLDSITILVTGNLATTMHGRVTFDISAETATNNGSTNLVDSGIDILENGVVRCWLIANLATITTPQFYVYPGAYNQSVAGDVVIDAAFIGKCDFVPDFAEQGAEYPWVRVFDDGVEVAATAITGSGSTVTITLASTPAADSEVVIYGGYGAMIGMQRHTIPIDDSAYALPAQSFKTTITA